VSWILPLFLLIGLLPAAIRAWWSARKGPSPIESESRTEDDETTPEIEDGDTLATLVPLDAERRRARHRGAS
jgi:hypothetical protein